MKSNIKCLKDNQFQQDIKINQRQKLYSQILSQKYLLSKKYSSSINHKNSNNQDQSSYSSIDSSDQQETKEFYLSGQLNQNVICKILPLIPQKQYLNSVLMHVPNIHFLITSRNRNQSQYLQQQRYNNINKYRSVQANIILQSENYEIPSNVALGLIKFKQLVKNKTLIKQCLAFLIYPNIVLTAAHNIYNHQSKKQKQILGFFIDDRSNRGSDMSSQYLIQSIYIPNQYKQKIQNQFQSFDFAILKISFNKSKQYFDQNIYIKKCKDLNRQIKYNFFIQQFGIFTQSKFSKIKELASEKLYQINFSFQKLSKPLKCTYFCQFLNSLKNKTINRINLSKNYLGQKAIKQVMNIGNAQCTLQELNLQQNNIGSLGMKYIFDKPFQKINILNLRNNGITDQGMTHFQQMNHNFTFLTYLNLEMNQISSKGIKYLTKQQKNNKHKFFNLKSLILNSNKISDEGFGYLLKHKKMFSKLQTLQLRLNCITSKVISVICQKRDSQMLKNLKCLLLSYNQIDICGIQNISKWIVKVFVNLEIVQLHSAQVIFDQVLRVLSKDNLKLHKQQKLINKLIQKRDQFNFMISKIYNEELMKKREQSKIRRKDQNTKFYTSQIKDEMQKNRESQQQNKNDTPQMLQNYQQKKEIKSLQNKNLQKNNKKLRKQQQQQKQQQEEVKTSQSVQQQQKLNKEMRNQTFLLAKQKEFNLNQQKKLLENQYKFNKQHFETLEAAKDMNTNFIKKNKYLNNNSPKFKSQFQVQEYKNKVFINDQKFINILALPFEKYFNKVQKAEQKFQVKLQYFQQAMVFKLQEMNLTLLQYFNYVQENKCNCFKKDKKLQIIIKEFKKRTFQRQQIRIHIHELVQQFKNMKKKYQNKIVGIQNIGNGMISSQPQSSQNSFKQKTIGQQ